MWGQQGTKPVKGIDIVIKCNGCPVKKLNVVKTDANGGFSVRIPEAGTYSLRFAAPPTLPDLPGTIRTSIAFQGDNPAESQVSFQKPSVNRALNGWCCTKGPTMSRLVPVGKDGVYSRQDLVFSGPGLFTGTLNAHRVLTSVDGLIFVAVEGQPAPAFQTVGVIAEGYRTFEYSASVPEGVERRWSVPIEGASGVWRGTGAKPELRVTVKTDGLPEGTYADELVITLRSGEQTELVRIPISIHIRPRTAQLGLQADRSVFVIPNVREKLTRQFQLTNPTNAEQTYSLQPASGTRAEVFQLPAARVRVRAGETVQVPVDINPSALKDGGDGGGGDFVPQCVEIRREPDGEVFLLCTLPILGPTTLEPLPEEPMKLIPLKPLRVRDEPGKCEATAIYPVLVGGSRRMLQGVASDLLFEVWDDCGLQRTDFSMLAVSDLILPVAGKAVDKEGLPNKKLMVQPFAAGKSTLRFEFRSGDLTREAEVDFEVESTPVPSMKAVKTPGLPVGPRPNSAKSQTIAPGAIVEVETTPVSENAELLFGARGHIPIRMLTRQGNVMQFRVPYDTDPSIPQVLRVRDANHTSAAFELPIVPASPTILRNPETGAQSFLRADDGSLTPVTAGTRAVPGSTIVVFADGLGSVDLSAAGKAVKGVLRSASGNREGINDGIGGQTVGLSKNPRGLKITPSEIVFTSDLPVALEGSPEGAFRITFTLPGELESPEPASGRVPFYVESQGVASEMADTYTPDPALLSSVFVTSQAVPFPATHGWNGVSQATSRGASETVGQLLTLDGPTPQPIAPGVRLRLADFVSNVTNSTAPDGTKWDIVVPNSPIQVDYAAIYEKDFRLTLQVNPPACGTLTTGPIASPDNWWAEGTTVPLTRTVNAGWSLMPLAVMF